jgi:hypothetical protein
MTFWMKHRCAKKLERQQTEAEVWQHLFIFSGTR